MNSKLKSLLKKKVLCAVALGAVMFGTNNLCYALPIVDSGKTFEATATIDQLTNKKMYVDGNGQNNILNWSGFNISKGESVIFDGGAKTKNYLNLVNSAGRSEIYGAIEGGNKVFLVNPNGIYFGDGASVNVGQLFVSTRPVDGVTFDTFDNITAAASNVSGDITNLSTVKANSVLFEGNNVILKNSADIQNETGTQLTGADVKAFAKNELAVGHNTKLDGTIATYEEDQGYKVSDLKWTTSGTVNDYMLVNNIDELQNIQNKLDGFYMFNNDINAEVTSSETSNYQNGFVPIGTLEAPFTGRINGLGYSVDKLSIRDTSLEYAGLIGVADGAELKGINMSNSSLTGKSYVGSIAGYIKNNTSVTGYNSGELSVWTDQGVENTICIGGLVGKADNSTVTGYSLGNLSLTVKMDDEDIVGCDVTAGNLVGDLYESNLVGYNKGNSTVMLDTGGESFAFYNTVNVGGLAGKVSSGSSITGYNNGDLLYTTNWIDQEMKIYVGGLAGNVYSIEDVSAATIEGYNTGAVSLYDTDTDPSEYKNEDVQLGGLVGKANKLNLSGYNTGDVSVYIDSTFDNNNSMNIAGLVGEASATNVKGYNTGTVEITQHGTGYATEHGGPYKEQPIQISGLVGTADDESTVQGQSNGTLSKDGDNVTITNWNEWEDEFNNDSFKYDLNLYGEDRLAWSITNKFGEAATWRLYTKDDEQGTPVSGYKEPVLKTLLVPFDLAGSRFYQTYNGQEQSIDVKNISIETEKTDGKDVGEYKVRALSSDIYDLIGTNVVTLEIIPAELTLDLSKTNTKTYDSGTATKEGLGANYSLNGIISIGEQTDDVALSSTSSAKIGQYKDKNVGENKTVTYEGVSLVGADAGNYYIKDVNNGVWTTDTGIITPQTITVVKIDGTNLDKIYNGNEKTTQKLSEVYKLDGVINNEIEFTATTKDLQGVYTLGPDVGESKEVTFNGIEITATVEKDLDNYIFNTTSITDYGTISPAELTLQAKGTDIVKTYDGNDNTLQKLNDVYELAGTQYGSDNVTLSGGDKTGTYNNKNAGEKKNVSFTEVSLTGTGSSNYKIANLEGDVVYTKGTIDKKSLTITAVDNTRTYNGDTNTDNSYTNTQLVAGDKITNVVTKFKTKDAGTGKTITVESFTIKDDNGEGEVMNDNYEVTREAATRSIINQATLTLSLKDGKNLTKEYDGTDKTLENLSATHELVGNIYGSDKVSLADGGEKGQYGDKKVGENKVVSYSGVSLTGDDAKNYSLTNLDEGVWTTNIGIINKRVIDITPVALTRDYNGTTATQNEYSLSKDLGQGDKLEGVETYFENPNVGSGKVMNVKEGFSILDAEEEDMKDNYQFNLKTETGAIDPAKLNLVSTGVVLSKTYDGNDNTLQKLNDAYTLDGTVYAGDTVTLTGGETTGKYDNKNAGEKKNVSFTGVSLTGTGSSNYKIANSEGDVVYTKGTIDKKSLTITAVDNTRTYNGDTNTDNSYTNTQLVAGDKITNVVTKFKTKDAGTGKTITVESFTIKDDNGEGEVMNDNYEVTREAATRSIINQAALTLSLKDGKNLTKEYDGTDKTLENLSATHELVGTIYGSDKVSLADGGEKGQYGDKKVDENKVVSYSGVSLTGDDAKNYSLTNLDEGVWTTNIGIINKRVIDITPVALDRIYNATANTNDEYSLNKDLGTGDTLEGVKVYFDNKKVANDKLMYVDGNFSIKDANKEDMSGNYEFNLKEIRTGKITPAELTLALKEGESLTKTYDGTKDTLKTLGETHELNGIISVGTVKDNVSLTTGASDGKGQYSDKKASKNLDVTYSNVELAGADKDNYVIKNVGTDKKWDTTGQIDKANLVLTPVTFDRTYDGTVEIDRASDAAYTQTGLVSAYDKISGVVTEYADKNAGTKDIGIIKGYTITDKDGVDMSDSYKIVDTETVQGTITQKALTLTPESYTRIYDGTVNTRNAYTQEGLVDEFDTISGVVTKFAAKDAGNEDISIQKGYTITDKDGVDMSGNYNITEKITPGTIDQKELILTANPAQSMQHEPLAPLSGKHKGFIAGEGTESDIFEWFTTANPDALAGKYGIYARFNPTYKGYVRNYSITNDPANDTAYTLDGNAALIPNNVDAFILDGVTYTKTNLVKSFFIEAMDIQPQDRERVGIGLSEASKARLGSGLTNEKDAEFTDVSEKAEVNAVEIKTAENARVGVGLDEASKARLGSSLTNERDAEVTDVSDKAKKDNDKKEEA